VAGNRRYRQLRAGAAHVCAVTLGDISFCWGNNLFKQLGAAASAPDRSNRPLRVETGGRIFRRLLPGGAHTCALTADGVAYCWGNNSSGQLGNGETGPTMSLDRVRGTLKFSQLSAGQDHTCGVAGGKAYCWGANNEGELGDGSRSNRTRPKAVTGGLTFKGVSASNQFTCGITANDRAYCWGFNSVGQLGDGTMGLSNSRLVPTRVLGGHSFSALGGMVSGPHACAVTPDQRAYCWGGNSSGQLGDGTLTNRTRPVAVN
jgi:alpha-tubulin suppressor-like RCC1 family protein